MALADGPAAGEAKVVWYNDPVVRGRIFQGLTLAFVVFLTWGIIHNTAVNLQSRNIAQGFGFLSTTAGFDIAQSLISYPQDADYGRAILVGLVNTVLVAVLGVILATIFGFIGGVARLSSNYVVRKLATGYVEIVRNVPLLLQIFFWYFGVLRVLPGPRDSIQPIPGWIFLNNRGLIMPQVTMTKLTADAMFYAVLAAIVAIVVLRSVFRKLQERTGTQAPVFLISLAVLIAFPVVAYLATGAGVTLTAPAKSTFNITGGTRVIPEFMALLMALAFYTGAFIAEIVRAGILAVSHGQTEAASSLGLKPNNILRLVVVPQALRVIIPPLTSQYLNLTKNSSLAVAVGYPDLVSTGGTVLNQTGQAVEVIAIWMVIYLGTSLTTSAFMNWYNAKMAIRER
ncbi:amino acid ABC transporter permease [Prosthecomicrobium hirschii]|uniref:amino acid ABC transporter permease n=1 Tax=Prosthecodimorpha hirschii TaxID=665126 RepID=UPI002220893F|nr:amino acid ABC transporter permease [Prosthecomicrobium hirschii]MCW1839062.1 amino acid ABC transporter permease [Prosthecomicrobium hirschii]